MPVLRDNRLADRLYGGTDGPGKSFRDRSRHGLRIPFGGFHCLVGCGRRFRTDSLFHFGRTSGLRCFRDTYSFRLYPCRGFGHSSDGPSGVLHLRTGEESRVFIDGDMEECRFPFSVSLKDFEVVYYPGTFSPTDYVSTLSVTDGGYTVELSVSMNRIGKYRGYRFYQSSYDEDGNGSTLSISYDPVGLPVTYTGYALLILSLVGFFFRKDSGFRNALHRLSKAGAAVMLAVLSAASMSVPASAASSDGAGSGAASSAGHAVARLPKHLPEKTAREFGRMFIYCNDRICPMQTFARDFTMKLYGRRSYMGLNPEQVLTGWIFYADSWEGTLESASGDGTGSGKRQRKGRNS